MFSGFRSPRDLLAIISVTLWAVYFAGFRQQSPGDKAKLQSSHHDGWNYLGDRPATIAAGQVLPQLEK
jgi:hypothetical protein